MIGTRMTHQMHILFIPEEKRWPAVGITYEFWSGCSRNPAPNHPHATG